MGSSSQQERWEFIYDRCFSLFYLFSICVSVLQFGHQPKVRLWDRYERTELAELSSHHFRISNVRFSPNGRHIVSVGSQEDQTVCVWDRQQQEKVACAKVSAKVGCQYCRGVLLKC